jgi:hypothetical protein
MKQIVLIIFLSLIFVLNFKAQDSEQFGELIPYTKWLAKVEEENKKIDCIISDTPSNKFEKIKISFKFETKTLPNGENIVLFQTQTNSKELVFVENSEGEIVSRIRYFGRITSKDNKFDRVFEEFMPITVKREQLENFFPIDYRRAFKLSKGNYTFNLAVSDVMTGNKAKKKFKFEIK